MDKSLKFPTLLISGGIMFDQILKDFHFRTNCKSQHGIIYNFNKTVTCKNLLTYTCLDSQYFPFGGWSSRRKVS